MVLGEMDVARVNPYRSGRGEPPSHLACFAPYRPAVVTQFRGGGRLEISLLALTRWTTSTRLGWHRAFGDDVWRGQKEGSVET